MGLWATAAPLLHSGILNAYGEGTSTAPTPIAYTPASTGVVENIDGCYEAAAQVLLLDGNTDSQIQGTVPTLSIRTADLTVFPKQGDAVTIRGVSFRVKTVEPDESGWCALRLADVT